MYHISDFNCSCCVILPKMAKVKIQKYQLHCSHALYIKYFNVIFKAR